MSKKDLPIDLMMKSVNWVPVDDYFRGVDDDLPKVTHNGSLNLEGITLRCYRLDNGEHVFDADDIEAFFKLH